MFIIVDDCDCGTGGILKPFVVMYRPHDDDDLLIIIIIIIILLREKDDWVGITHEANWSSSAIIYWTTLFNSYKYGNSLFSNHLAHRIPISFGTLKAYSIIRFI